MNRWAKVRQLLQGELVRFGGGTTRQLQLPLWAADTPRGILVVCQIWQSTPPGWDSQRDGGEGVEACLNGVSLCCVNLWVEKPLGAPASPPDYQAVSMDQPHSGATHCHHSNTLKSMTVNFKPNQYQFSSLQSTARPALRMTSKKPSPRTASKSKHSNFSRK